MARQSFLDAEPLCELPTRQSDVAEAQRNVGRARNEKRTCEAQGEKCKTMPGQLRQAAVKVKLGERSMSSEQVPLDRSTRVAELWNRCLGFPSRPAFFAASANAPRSVDGVQLSPLPSWLSFGSAPIPKRPSRRSVSPVRSLERRASRRLSWSSAWRECERHPQQISKVLMYRRPFRVDDPSTRMALVIWSLLVCLASLSGHRRRSSSRIVEPCGHRPTGKEGIT
jgi:hypothetical protein